MPITYRNLKGAPLSADELDQNFRELHQRLEVLETAHALQGQGGLASISQEGADVIFKNAAGEHLGHITLPVLALRPRGNWSPQESYLFYDLCLVEDKTYLCKTAHTSGTLFAEDVAHWDLMIGSVE